MNQMRRQEEKAKMRCPDYDDPTKITDETANEYLCEYCGMRKVSCDGKGNISVINLSLSSQHGVITVK